MTKIVIAQFLYCDPRTDKEYTVQRGWPCKDEQDANRIVKYYGMKTGAFQAQCVMEEVSDEEIKQIASGPITKEAHQA